jgi:ribosome-binding protein aMBF1 (putative translation factor)
MKCKLCKKNKALLKAKVGNSIIEVCLYCVMTERLEPVEVLNVWEEREVKELMEERNQTGTELHLPSMQEDGDEQKFEHPPLP